MANPPDLGSGYSEFESRAGYQVMHPNAKRRSDVIATHVLAVSTACPWRIVKLGRNRVVFEVC